MNNDNQSSEVKTKNITFGLVFSWLFGIVVGIPAIMELFTHFIPGLLMLISVVIVFPPTYNLIKNKLHVSLSRGLKAGLVIILLIIAGSVLVSAQGVASLASSGSPATVTSAQPAQAQQTTMKVTAMKLSDDYKANEIAADAKYKGNTIQVSGTVSDIGTDILNTPYITFDTGEFSTLGVQCMFNKGDESVLANLNKGQSLVVTGVVSGGGKVLNVLLENCQIVK